MYVAAQPIAQHWRGFPPIETESGEFAAAFRDP